MAGKIIDIKKYLPKSSDIFFFDNNVWMYLFCPLANFNQYKQKHYSSFLNSVNTSRSTIFINSLVLSEFSNRYLRMDFEQWKDKLGMIDSNYKNDYVGTESYKETVIEIKQNINLIMKLCEKSSDNFNAIDLNFVFKHLSCVDFNDSYYLELAKLSNWKIVTDDYDFVSYTGHDVEVITLLN